MGLVLVIDDEFGIADLIDAMLTDEGHRVLMAANGKQALDLLAKERPNLIFLDYMMPVMDGCALLSLMAKDPAWSGIAVVMMSSMPETIVAERCSGYHVFLRKPFKIAQVIELTNRFLAVSSAPAPE